MKTLTLFETAQFLKTHDNYILVSHRRPDGDTVGSCAALCMALRKIGKKAYLYPNPQFTPKFARWREGLEGTPEDGMTVVTVDVATAGLFPLDFPADVRPALAIDHHGTNTGFAELTCVDAGRAACGEIIWELLPFIGAAPDAKIAEAIYVAISTDTGCFRYSNTTAGTLDTAAACKRAGADTFFINRTVFDIKSRGRWALESYLIQNIEFYAGGKISVSAIPSELMEELQLTEDDIDDISGFGRNIEGVEIAVMLRNVENNTGKVSVRTSPNYDAAAICARFGGGGHAAAAGGSVDGGIEAAKQTVLQSLREEHLL